MDLQRCSDQRGTLEEFYLKLSEKRDSLGEGAKAMLSLMVRLRSERDGRKAFGLTSHARLCLLASDSVSTPWYVSIEALDRNNYFIEYLMPSAVAPWPGARVRGEARTEDDALGMLQIAIDKCDGWKA